MTIEEAKEAKQQLRKTIMLTLQEFEAVTGLAVLGVRVARKDYSVGTEDTKSLLTAVSVSVRL